MIRRGRQAGRFAQIGFDRRLIIITQLPTVMWMVLGVKFTVYSYYMVSRSPLLEPSRVPVPYGVELRTTPVEAETFQDPGACWKPGTQREETRNETGKRSKGNGRAKQRRDRESQREME